jgi:DNA-binding IclR family transcriptional regulator
MRASRKNAAADAVEDEERGEGATGQVISPVVRAFRLLHYIAEGRSTENLSDMARQIDINRITATRLLATLEHEGMIERLPQGGHRLGLQFLSLAATGLGNNDLFGFGRRLLAQLAEELQLSAYLTVPDDAHVLYILREMPETPLVSNIRPGSRIPALLMTPGRMMLAHRPPEARRAALEVARQDPRGKHFTPAKMDAMLDADRERGCAWSFSGYESGIDACAAPVFDARAQPVAAISVAGPDKLFHDKPEFQQKTEQAVRQTAAMLSQLLGHVPGK